jgi:hypothetical protein
MGSEEPLTNREILGKFEDVRRDQASADTRIARVAADAVTTEAWQRENGHIQRDIAEVDAHCEERHKITMNALEELKRTVEKKSEFTWNRFLAIASILVVLIAAWYTALHQGGH